MSALDPEDEAPVGAQDTQSSDQSKPGLRKAWEAWSSRPENNAALLQFGVAMLQPHAPGQTSLGAAANAVAEGAGASERNVAEQRSEQATQFEQGIKSRTAGAHELTAQAYADQVAQGKAKTGGLQGKIATQRAFNQWLKTPTDSTGLSTDSIVGAIQKIFPEVKTKSDLLANPQALAKARQLFETAMPEPDEDTGAPPTAPTGGAPAGVVPVQPPTPQIAPGKAVYNKATGALAGYWYPDKGFVPLGK